MENNDKKVWGLDPKAYDILATNHSKTNVILWIIGGLIYNFFYGDLISLSSGLVIFPGMFIASFASMLTFWVNTKKMEIVPATNNVFVLIGFTIWYVFDLIYPVFISILFINLINYLFN